MSTETLFEKPANAIAVSKSGNYIPQHEERSLMPLQPPSMIEVVARAASDPSVDLDKMERLIDLQVKLMELEAIRSFNADLASMQEKIMPVVKRGNAAFNTKNGGRTEYAFAKYADIDAMVKPVLTEFGFSLSFSLDGKNYTGKLSHKMGHSISTSIPLPIDDSGSKNAIQSQGSTITYAMRYLTCMMLNIATLEEDDDGHSYGTLSREQIDELELDLIDTGAHRGKFLQFMGVDSISLIPTTDFTRAKTALKSYATGTPVNLNLKKKL
jgi:hypothetical protein